MIEVTCGCPGQRNLPESAAGKKLRCPKCSQNIHLVCAEALTDGAGLGDFDAELTIVTGPENAGMRLLLGGVADLSIGKLPERTIALPGVRVSREHCRLVRVNFGPSVWKIVDNKSTNGLLVNGQRISEEELHDGDVITIGEYQLKYDRVPSASAALAPPSAARSAKPGPATAAALAGGPACPSCEKSLPRGAKICVDCGIRVPSGRPLITRSDVDLNSLYEGARQILWVVSLILRVQPIPLPIRSEAYGTRKPYAIWAIAAITVIASIAFFIAQNTADRDALGKPGNNLMLWPPSQTPDRIAAELSPAMVREFLHEIPPDQYPQMHREVGDPDDRLSDEQAARRALATSLPEFIPHEEFHPYQLFTHIFLHDTTSVLGFLLHLGGNMLFLMVFGTRVNALIGNIATAIIYPILGVCAGLVQMNLGASAIPVPSLGASGAIMGLAGMYLILFPVHRIYCAMWWRLLTIYAWKIFPVRGFWVLLVYFGYDILMNCLNAFVFHSVVGGGVAHWAHIGGFTTGMLLGLAVLASRLFNTHGGDLLSVTLGRFAWPLIGKPSRWAVPAAASFAMAPARSGSRVAAASSR